MKKISLVLLALAGIVINSHAANVAARVISYDPGVGSAAGFTNIEAVLGDPSRVNPFGDAVDLFDPPYGTSQILSLGEGGSVTIKFTEPVRNDRRNPFGLDFMVFGNSGFIITNEFDLTTFDWIGIPATDGSLFANNSGQTRVSVSRDGVLFFILNPAVAPVVDGLFPTDNVGDFTTPVNPALTASHFAGQTLDDIRALYDGAAGGTGYDIAWAQDANGRAVHLSFINYVRVEVLSGKSEIDAFTAVAR